MTATLNQIERETVETVVERLAAMRSNWMTRDENARREPRSRKLKGEANEARARFEGAADLAANVLNCLVPSANYTPFGVQMRLGDFAAREGLKPLDWTSNATERAAHFEARDRVVRSFTDEIVAPR